MKSYAFLFWAYLVIWLGLAGYLAMLMRRLGRVQRRLDNLDLDQARHDGSAGAPPARGS